MFGIGKGKVIKALNDGFRINKLGDTDSDMDEIYRECERFMLACYLSSQSENMSVARYDVWLSKLSKKNASAAPPLRSLPPTTETFREHVKRAHLQASIFLASGESEPPDLFPTELEWSYDQQSKCYDPVSIPPDAD